MSFKHCLSLFGKRDAYCESFPFLGAFGLTYGCYLVMGFEKDRIFKLLEVVSTESSGAVHDRRKNDWENY